MPLCSTISTVQQLTSAVPQVPAQFKINPTFNMQKFILCAFALVAVVAAAPQDLHDHQEHPAYILKQDSFVNPDGYHFEFETSDGISRQEQGTLKQISADHQAIEVNGSYRYTAPDGLIYTVTFVADEHGFQPQEHVEHPGQ